MLLVHEQPGVFGREYEITWGESAANLLRMSLAVPLGVGLCSAKPALSTVSCRSYCRSGGSGSSAELILGFHQDWRTLRAR